MLNTHPEAQINPPIRTDLGAIFVSLELSRKAWVTTSLSPGLGKLSKHTILGGDTKALFELLARLQAKAEQRNGRAFPLIVIQEAGLDGFWIHRCLQNEGIESHVVDSASIAVSLRSRRAKTDRIDGETLIRTLMAFKRGEPRVCAMITTPTPDQEDRRRVSRERATLIKERIEHVNRIKGLLFAQGVFDYEPMHRDRRQRLEAVQTGDGRPLPDHLKRQITRELDRLELLLSHIKTVEARAGLAHESRRLLTRRVIDTPEVHWPGDRRRSVDGGAMAEIRQSAAAGGLCRSCTNALAERVGRTRAGNLPGGKPAPAQHNDRAGLVIASPSAGIGPEPLVPRQGRIGARPRSANQRCRTRSQTADRTLALRNARGNPRGCGIQCPVSTI
jgi:transposase